ncbi:hypothetical protein ACP4OV_027046 [Aristida adscensionis]
MPEKSRKRSDGPAAATAGGEDRLGALPDDALLRVLSLLPSEDAVRTCALARRWRHLWRSVPALRVDCGGDGRRWDARWLHRFVAAFLRLRDGRVPLEECDIYCRPLGRGRGGAADVALCFRAAQKWIRHAVSRCGARVLKVAVYTPVQGLELPDAPLISQHLTTVDLFEVELESQTLDLSGCPALEDLEMSSCSIGGEIILLPSVKRLKIICYLRIPGLLLCLRACRRLQQQSSVMVACYGCYGNLLFEDDNNDQCVLLDGLSGAMELELIAQPEVWSIIEASGCYNAREGSLVSKHLMVVEVKYHEDEVLHKLLMILNTCGVPPEKVAIRKSNSRSSERSSVLSRGMKTVDLSSISRLFTKLSPKFGQWGSTFCLCDRHIHCAYLKGAMGVAGILGLRSLRRQ